MNPKSQCPFCHDTCIVSYTISRKGKTINVIKTLKSHVFHYKVVGCSDCLMNRSTKLSKEIIDHMIVSASTMLDHEEES